MGETKRGSTTWGLEANENVELVNTLAQAGMRRGISSEKAYAKKNIRECLIYSKASAKKQAVARLVAAKTDTRINGGKKKQNCDRNRESKASLVR